MMAILGNHRRFSLLLTASLLSAVSAFGWLHSRSEMSGDAAIHMSRAAAYYDSLVVLTRDERGPARPDSSTALSLGYLERLRLGLGSPFRLVDFALDDPRLDDSTRTRVAWAILARLRRGDAYVIDPAAADAIDDGTHSVEHLALIDRAIESAPDPRAGELTVRLAYALAAGEQTISEQGDAVATQIAALLRDRVLAQADLRDLLHDASVRHIDPLEELVRRRRTRAFEVERPAAAPLDPDLQSEAMAAVPKLLDAIRALHRAPDVATKPSPAAYAPLLGAAIAARLVSLGDDQPPEPPVAVTIRSHRFLLLGADSTPDVQKAREQFVADAVNGETLAGEYGLLIAAGDTARSSSALAVLGAATALRAMAQETPWFPGMPAPTVADLRAEFGLAGVSFGREVKREWQPYYLNMIGTSLRDLQRVLSGFSVAGLRISIAAGGLPDTILALHDPATRTIRMSIYSSAGTLAHELAHDLDWQAARSLYAGSGYSTDRAVREQRGPLAASMRDLASARVVRRGAPAEERPAEVFARSVDWLVAVSLAREGRSDGYLSAVQDAAITGYTTVSPVAMIFGAARPLVDAVEEMTYLPTAVRDGFLDQWADARSVDPYLLVRHALTLSPGRRRLAPPTGFFADDPLGLTTQGVAICVADGAELAPELRARERLLDLALDARALGIARMRARWFPAAHRPAWASSILEEAPWSATPGEQAVRRIRAGLVAQLDASRGGDQLRFATPSIFRPSASTCSLSER
jgi:hypothetical protein